MEFRKMVMITLYARQQKRHRCLEWTFGLCGKGQGWDDLGENIETCILSCKKRIASLCPMQDTGCLGLVHGDDPERCYGKGGGRGVHVWECIYTCGWRRQWQPTPVLLPGKSHGQRSLVGFMGSKRVGHN